MIARPRWRDAHDFAGRIHQPERGRSLLATVARLPFVCEGVLEQLVGVKRGSLDRFLADSLDHGLLAAITPPLTAGHNPRLFHLTDLGLAVLALVDGVEPGALAIATETSRAQLLRLLPSLPALQDAYQLLGAIAASRSEPPALLRWEWPWRCRYHRRTNKSPVWFQFPALAQVQWRANGLECFLVPDRGNLPMGAYRSKRTSFLKGRK